MMHIITLSCEPLSSIRCSDLAYDFNRVSDTGFVRDEWRQGVTTP